MKAKKELIGAGLTEREAIIYLAILQHGQVTQSDISHITNTNRTTLYDHIESLLIKDCITQTIRGKRTYYSAQNPLKILRKLEKTQQEFLHVLPILQEVYRNVGHKPSFTVREGTEPMAKLFRHVAETAFYIKSFSSPSNYLKHLPFKEARYFDVTTEKRDVKPQVLCADTTENIKALKPFSRSWIDIKLLPSTMHSPMEVLLYNKSTLITSWDKLITVEIESEDITKFLESLFDYYWKSATLHQKGVRPK